MKLQEIKLFNKYRSLEPFPNGIQFLKHKLLKDQLDPIGLVGLNGSGKSNFLELLADIFYELEVYFLEKKELYKEEKPSYFAYANNKTKEPIFFEIKYKININSQTHEIKVVRKENNPSEPFFYIKKEITDTLFGGIDYVPLPKDSTTRKYLPRVVAYTSGLNDLLTLPFIDLQDYYAQQVTRVAVHKKSLDINIPAPNFQLLNYESNAAIVVSNFLLGTKEKLQIFKQELRIERINSFRIVIRLNKLYGNKEVKLTHELKNYIQLLQDSASLTDILVNEGKGNEYVFDFIYNKATLELFKLKFGTPQRLFDALTKLNLLNTLCIKAQYRTTFRSKREKGQLIKFPQVASLDKIFSIENIELVLSHPNVRTEYEKISDGEHQFLHIVGGIMLFDEVNPEKDLLYLLDEPDTHFNPLWRSTLFYQLDLELNTNNTLDKKVSILKNKDIEFLLTTHSPFILSDCHGYNVFKFERNGDSVSFNRVKEETYGATFHNILGNVFNLIGEKNEHFKSQIAKQSFLEIENIQDEINKINNRDEWLSKSDSFVKRIRMLGDSLDKIYLLKSFSEKEASFKLQQ